MKNKTLTTLILVLGLTGAIQALTLGENIRLSNTGWTTEYSDETNTSFENITFLPEKNNLMLGNWTFRITSQKHDPTYQNDIRLNTTFKTISQTLLELDNKPSYEIGWCRQETATSATSCGGLATGLYDCTQTGENVGDCTKMYDGDWNTATESGNHTLLVNYTLPTTALNNSILQYSADGTPPIGQYTTNTTIPDACMTTNKLQLKIEIDRPPGIGAGEVKLYCHETTGWHDFNIDSSYLTENFYEEAVFWRVKTREGSLYTRFNITGIEADTSFASYKNGLGQGSLTSSTTGFITTLINTGYDDNEIQFIKLGSTPEDTLGSCLTVKGYNYTQEVGPSINWLQINFSRTGIVENNCTNIQTNNPAFLYATDSLLIATSSEKNVSIYIGGSELDYEYLNTDQTPDIIINLTVNDLTLENNFYKIQMYNEESGETWDYNEVSGQVLNVLCDNHAPDVINLSTINQDTFYISTLETPLLHFQASDVIDRKYEPYTSSETIKIYNINDSHTYNEVDFYLEDYTGGFGDSYLQVITRVNTTLEKIWQQEWYHLSVTGVDLLNNTYYQFKIYTPSETRTIAWKLIENDDYIVITTRQLDFTDKVEWYDGIAFGFTSDYASSSVGAAWNVTTGSMENVTFTVYNYTSNTGYNEIYNTHDDTSGNTGSITFVTPNQNHTYYLVASLDTTDYETVTIRELINPAHTLPTKPEEGTYNLPSTIAGINTRHIYTAAATFIMTTVAMGFGPYSVGTGALVLTASIGMSKYLGWLPEVSWPLFYVLFTVAVLFKLSEGRRPR